MKEKIKWTILKENGEQQELMFDSFDEFVAWYTGGGMRDDGSAEQADP